MDRGRIMSEEERKEILEWILVNKHRFMELSQNRLHHLIIETPDERVTARLRTNENHPYDPGLPVSVWDIKRRIFEKEEIEHKVEPVFQDFIAVIGPQGYIHKHVDDNQANMIHCRFNVFFQLPTKGGETFYNGKPANTKEGHYVFSKSGLEEHYTHPIEEGERIVISFGCLIPHAYFLYPKNNLFQ
jgi:hypothetical protein